jgi:hypothetical protein
VPPSTTAVAQPGKRETLATQPTNRGLVVSTGTSSCFWQTRISPSGWQGPAGQSLPGRMQLRPVVALALRRGCAARTNFASAIQKKEAFTIPPTGRASRSSGEVKLDALSWCARLLTQKRRSAFQSKVQIFDRSLCYASPRHRTSCRNPKTTHLEQYRSRAQQFCTPPRRLLKKT